MITPRVSELDVRVGAPERPERFPVLEPVRSVLPDGALPRGRTVHCHGPAAVSLAVAVAVAAVRDGAWLGVVGVPTFGPDAAAELGLELLRTVAVEVPPHHPRDWAERVAAALDGLDLVLTAVPPRVPDRLVRSIHQRLRTRGGVLLTLPPALAPGAPGVHRVVATPGASRTTADVELATALGAWRGADGGAGRLLGRLVSVTTEGRRVPRPFRTDLWLPGPDGAVGAVRVAPAGLHAASA